MHRGNDRLPDRRRLAEAPRDRLFPDVACARIALTGALLEVRSCAEGTLASALKHGHTKLGIGAKRSPGFNERLVHLQINGVQRVGTIERDPEYATVTLGQEGG